MAIIRNNYNEDVADAKEMIAEFGQSVKWRQFTTTEDTDEPWKDANATVKDNKVDVCFVPAKDNDWRKFLAHIKGTEVPSGRLAGLMAGGQKFVPSLKDQLIRDGEVLLIDTIDEIKPAEITVLYIIEFKR